MMTTKKKTSATHEHFTMEDINRFLAVDLENLDDDEAEFLKTRIYDKIDTCPICKERFNFIMDEGAELDLWF